MYMICIFIDKHVYHKEYITMILDNLNHSLHFLNQLNSMWVGKCAQLYDNIPFLKIIIHL